MVKEKKKPELSKSKQSAREAYIYNELYIKGILIESSELYGKLGEGLAARGGLIIKALSS